MGTYKLSTPSKNTITTPLQHPNAYNTPTTVLPSHVANAAIGSKNTHTMVNKYQGGVIPKTQAFHCKICFCLHPESRCESRGEDWIPKWIRQNATKYNAQYPHDTPDPTYVNADPPLRYMNQYKQ